MSPTTRGVSQVDSLGSTESSLDDFFHTEELSTAWRTNSSQQSTRTATNNNEDWGARNREVRSEEGRATRDASPFALLIFLFLPLHLRTSSSGQELLVLSVITVKTYSHTRLAHVLTSRFGFFRSRQKCRHRRFLLPCTPSSKWANRFGNTVTSRDVVLVSQSLSPLQRLHTRCNPNYLSLVP